MAVESKMLELGTRAPDFALTDTVRGETVKLVDFDAAGALVVVFVSNHCPYVKHIQEGLAAFGRDYRDKDVAIVAIGPNDPVAYPEDDPEELGRVARHLGYAFPVLFDESQDVAAAYAAACTPDFFVFGPDRGLVYRGRFGPSRPNSGIPVTGEELRAAVDAVLAGEPVAAEQYPSIGCSIKWKPENAPVGFA
jgi:peroxiredoxin